MIMIPSTRPLLLLVWCTIVHWKLVVPVLGWTASSSSSSYLPTPLVVRQAPYLAAHQDSSSLSSSSAANGSGNDDDKDFIQIRTPTYREMSFVADVIMKCFYQDSKPPARGLFRLGELNRIQQNFPYDPAQHQMLVAVASSSTNENGRSGKDSKIVGFIDIDDRKPNRPTAYAFNPRPYLSDLCVDPEFQNRGLGRRLVRRGEEFAQQQLGKKEVYIRVAQDNEAALHMYTRRLGYQEYSHPDEGEQSNENGKIILLRKELSPPLTERCSPETTETTPTPAAGLHAASS